MTIFRGVAEGERNTTGHELVKYFLKFEKRELIYKLLICWNEKNKPPLRDIDIIQIVKGAIK